MTEQPLRTPVEESTGIPDIWRDEVQARLERYKRRRGRRIEGAFTMRFPFPPDESANAVAEQFVDSDEAPGVEPPVALEATELARVEEVGAPLILGEAIAIATPPEDCELTKAKGESAPQEAAAPFAPTTSAVAVAPDPKEEPERVIELPPRPMPRRKVIAFPAPSYTQSEVARRIADPVQPEQLRILDVPEELQAIQSTPFLDGLLDAPAGAAPGVQRDMLDLPCATVAAPKRLGAAAIDLAVTLGALAIFTAAANRMMSAPPPTKFLIAGVVAAAVLLWATYQYLFLVYSGRTLGMLATGLRLQTFKGRLPDFRRRRLRVVALYLSVLSLGMGVLWYLVDVDSLCWHDRISQTFPCAADKS